jgi:hypothetical protein
MDNLNHVVHIGCLNMLPGSPQGPAVSENTKYTCFEHPDLLNEIDKRHIDEEYKKIPEELRARVSVEFRNAENTGLLSDSIDEVHMYNVLGYGSTKNKEEIINEAHRILKPLKQLYVGETIPPPYPFEDLLIMCRRKFSVNVLSPDLKQHGSEDEIKRFYELIVENQVREIYNKNFFEWYPLLMNLKVNSGDYKLNPEEMEIINNIRGKESGRGYMSKGSYLVELVKIPQKTSVDKTLPNIL